MQTNLPVRKLRLPRCFSFGCFLLQYSMDFFRNLLIVMFLFSGIIICRQFFAKEFNPRQICRADHVFVHSRPQSPSFLGQISAEWLWGREWCSYATPSCPRYPQFSLVPKVLYLPSSKDPRLSCKGKFFTQLQPSCFAYCIKATVTWAKRASCSATLPPN